jgi:hypothetical protein
MQDVPNPTPYTAAWHAAEEADERAWLDHWARTQLIPQPAWTTLDPAATTGSLPVLAAC